MAKATAYYGVDMLDADISYGYVTRADASTIRIESGSWVAVYKGSFSYDYYDNVYGRLASYTESYRGDTWFSVTGINRDARTFQSFLDWDDALGALNYVLSGADSLTGSRQDDTLAGFAGNDTIRGGAGMDTIFGDDGNDVLSGGGGHDEIDGGSGSDRALYLGSIGVTVNLGLTGWQGTGHGRDLLSGIERVSSGSGNDRLTGNGTANVLSSGAGNDVLDGGSGNDNLLGGDGTDTLTGGAGNDRLDGGAGSDRAVFTGSPSTAVNLYLKGAQNTGHGIDVLAGIEHVTSGAGNDRLSGNGAANVLSSGAGDDLLNGAGGNDRLVGGYGNDSLTGGLGNDMLVGGSGSDRAVFTGSSSAVVNLNLAGAQNTGHGIDILANIEHVSSGAGNDRLSGNGTANVLSSGAGNDFLNGAGGDDRLVGGTGHDFLNGAGGDDRLVGGLGRDVLSGGSGSDAFAFLAAAEAGRGTMRDVIRDFQHGTDEIDLSAIDADLRLAGDQAFEFIGAAAFGGVAGELKFRGSVLSGDTNGDAVADFEIALAGGISLDAGDFVF